MRIRIRPLPALSAAAALAWLIAQLGDLPWLAWFVTVFVLFGSGLVALARRRQPQRSRLVLGLATGAVVAGAVLAFLLLTEGGDTHGLVLMLALATILILPIPLLYALTFPAEPGDPP